MLSYYFTGYQILSVPMEEGGAFLELCRREGLVYDNFKICDNDCLTLRMRSATAKKAARACAAEGISLDIIKERGLPRLLGRLLAHPGLCLGFAVAVALLWCSSRFVWDVRVTGNHLLSEREVEATLRECGFGVGSYLGSFKADRVENKALITNKSLAWISVNMKGNVAYVQVREAVHTPPPEANAPANLVADTGGQIVRVELVQGNVLVAAGQWVGKGDLLVSGLYDSQQQGIRYTHAEGRVYARVMDEIVITVPLTYSKKIHSAEKQDIHCEKTLIFFENPIKFSKKDFNSEMSCDIIKRVSVPFSEWGVDFPISMVTEWYIPYTIIQEKRTYAEAETLAYLELARRIGSLQGGAEVLSKTITTTLGEDAYILTCHLTCIRDIAKEQTFEVLP